MKNAVYGGPQPGNNSPSPSLSCKEVSVSGGHAAPLGASGVTVVTYE